LLQVDSRFDRLATTSRSIATRVELEGGIMNTWVRIAVPLFGLAVAITADAVMVGTEAAERTAVAAATAGDRTEKSGGRAKRDA
jgi:hypothetical protein